MASIHVTSDSLRATVKMREAVISLAVAYEAYMHAGTNLGDPAMLHSRIVWGQSLSEKQRLCGVVMVPPADIEVAVRRARETLARMSTVERPEHAHLIENARRRLEALRTTTVRDAFPGAQDMGRR